MTAVLTAYPTATTFAPAHLDGADWSQVGPLYTSLLARTLKCKGCLENLLLDRSELDAAVDEAHASLYIEMTRHTDDHEIKAAFLRFVEEIEPNIKDISFKIDRMIVQCPFADDLDQNRYHVLFRGLEADVKLFREKNIALEVDETKLGQEYSELCGAMTVEFDGEEKTLPQMGPHMQENDRDVREQAFRVVAARRLQDSERMDEIFDKMVVLRNTMADNADLDDYRDWAFHDKHRFDYTPETCESFHRGVLEQAVPLMHTMNARHRGAMGVDVLRPWDLDVDPLGREPLRPFNGSTELIEGTSRIFHRMNPSLGELFDTMRTGDTLDLESRKGKAPGGYQHDRERQRLPFIFMNAAGLMRDVDTMVHEAGHAFHYMLSRDEPLVSYRQPPSEFAEVASMSMELIALPFLDEFLSEADAARARRRHLEGVVSRLCWVATIDAFQHWLYTHPHHTREQRDTCWLELHARFGPDVSWEGLEAEVGVAFLVAAFSALRKASAQPGLLVLGDLSIQGNIKPIRSLMEPLQVAMDNGAKRAMIPIENKRGFFDVSAEVLENVDAIFYGEVKQAVFKALGLV